MTLEFKGIGGHHSNRAQTDEWLTPPFILEALGGAGSFDLAMAGRWACSTGRRRRADAALVGAHGRARARLRAGVAEPAVLRQHHRHIEVGGAVGTAFLRASRGPVRLDEIYRAFAGHPKTAGNRYWREKIRQTLQRAAERTGPGEWKAVAA